MYYVVINSDRTICESSKFCLSIQSISPTTSILCSIPPLSHVPSPLSLFPHSFADDHATCAGFQRNTSTGNQRRIRRRLVAGDKNVLWRWQGDAPEHTWHPYAYDISLKLESIKSECELNQAEPEMDLQTYFANYPYTVDVLKVYFLLSRRLTMKQSYICNFLAPMN